MVVSATDPHRLGQPTAKRDVRPLARANTYHLRDAAGVDHQHGRPERRPTTDQSRWQCDIHCVTGGFYVWFIVIKCGKRRI